MVDEKKTFSSTHSFYKGSSRLQTRHQQHSLPKGHHNYLTPILPPFSLSTRRSKAPCKMDKNIAFIGSSSSSAPRRKEMKQNWIQWEEWMSQPTARIRKSKVILISFIRIIQSAKWKRRDNSYTHFNFLFGLMYNFWKNPRNRKKKTVKKLRL